MNCAAERRRRDWSILSELGSAYIQVIILKTTRLLALTVLLSGNLKRARFLVYSLKSRVTNMSKRETSGAKTASGSKREFINPAAATVVAAIITGLLGFLGALGAARISLTKQRETAHSDAQYMFKLKIGSPGEYCVNYKNDPVVKAFCSPTSAPPTFKGLWIDLNRDMVTIGETPSKILVAAFSTGRAAIASPEKDGSYYFDFQDANWPRCCVAWISPDGNLITFGNQTAWVRIKAGHFSDFLENSSTPVPQSPR